MTGHDQRNAHRASGLSHSLGRLRELLDDPLFVRSGSGMTPTPRAEELADHVHAALMHMRLALEELSSFEPASSHQTFRVGASDDIQLMMLPSLLESVRRVAPGVRIEILDLPGKNEAYRSLTDGELDVAVGRFERLDPAGPGIHRALIFESQLVCLVRAGHPRIDGKISLDQYL